MDLDVKGGRKTVKESVPTNPVSLGAIVNFSERYIKEKCATQCQYDSNVLHQSLEYELT